MWSSNNISENFKEHLYFYSSKDLTGFVENLYIILKMYLSVSMSYNSSERLFSSLCHLKIFTKNAISHERLTNIKFFTYRKDVSHKFLIKLLSILMPTQRKEAETLVNIFFFY